MRRRYRRRIVEGVIASLLVIITIMSWYLFTENSEEQIEPQLDHPYTEQLVTLAKDPLDIDRYSLVDVAFVEGKIVLKANCTTMALSVTAEKAYSIQRGMLQKLEIRPNEHDIIKELLDHFGIEVILVKIENIANDMYYADVFVKKENEILNLDVKPSDAIALAQRFKAKVYVKDNVLQRYGQKSC